MGVVYRYGIYPAPLHRQKIGVNVGVFGVLNSKTKKKIKEYERFFGPISKNHPTYYNIDTNNPYGAQPVNTTGMPMGTTPAGNAYIPQNDVNNQQGGQF